MLDDVTISTTPSRLACLARKLRSRVFRANYMSRQLKTFLAAQMRSLRGDDSQAEFGRKIGRPQSVVSRFESQGYGKANVSTLIEIAQKLDVALLVRFVDWPTFLRFTDDCSESAFAPQSYDQATMDAMLRKEEDRTAASVWASYHNAGRITGAPVNDDRVSVQGEKPEGADLRQRETTPRGPGSD